MKHWTLLITLLAVACSSQIRTIHSPSDSLSSATTVTRTFDVPENGSLVFTANIGNITLTPWEKTHIELRATRKLRRSGSSGAVEATFSIEAERNSGILTISARSKRTRNVDVRFELLVPSVLSANLKTRGGNIQVGDLTGKIEANTSGGNIGIGTITNGPVSARTSGGNIRVGDVLGGSLKVNTSGGNISIANVSRSVHARTSGGNIRLGNVEGDADVSTSGGNIKVQHVEGVLAANTSGGNISIAETGGKLDVSTSGGNITLGPGGGTVQARTSGGNITSGGSAGPLEVRTSGGNISITNAQDAINAHTSGGNVKAELNYARPKLLDPCTLSSSGGTVTLYLPSGLGANIDANLRLRKTRKDYRITTDFDLDTVKEHDHIHSQGMINGGGATITIETTNGHIKILKL